MVNAKNSNRQIGEELDMLRQLRATQYKTGNMSHSVSWNQPEKNRLNGPLRSKL